MASPNERDIINFPLVESWEFRLLFQRNLGAKGRLKEMSPGDRSDLLSKVRTDLATNPLHAKDNLCLARLYEIENKIDDAINLLENLLNKGIKNVQDIYVQLIFLYERNQNYKKAYHTYEEVIKPRPIILLRKLPRDYDEFLVCGLSSRQNFVAGFDQRDSLHGKDGVIRLGFLGRIPQNQLRGRTIIGKITPEEHISLLEKLREYLKDPLRDYLGIQQSGIT